MADEDLTIKARIDDELSRPLEHIRDEVKGAGNDAEDAGRRAGRSSRGWDLMGRAAERGGRMARAAGRAAKWALIGIGAGVAALGYATGRLVRSSIGEAREAQKVGRITEQIIRSTGGAANLSAKQVADLAGRISEKAGIDDEAIQSGANLLLTFKKIRNEAGKGNKIFDRATAAAVDLSAAGFGSIESGSKMLGKALNDPVKGMTALSRAGVTFTAEQTETVKKLVESNDVLSAQKIILGEVESQVGGVAAAQATFGEKAAVVWGNLQERLGTALLPLLDRFSRWFVQKGGPALDHYIGIFEDKGVPALRRFIARTKELATEYLPKAKSLLGDVADVTKTGAGYAKDLVGAFTSMPSWARKAMLGGAAAGVLAHKTGLTGLVKGLGKGAGGLAALATKAKPLPVWVVNNGGLGGDGLPGGKPKGPKIPAWMATFGFAAAAGAGTDAARRVTASAVGEERASAIQMGTYGSAGAGGGVGAGALTFDDLDETAADRRKKALAETAAEVEKVARAADLGRLKAAGFGTELDLVGSRKVTATVKADQIDRANDAWLRFTDLQRQADRPIAPYIALSGYDRAMQQISTLTSAIHSIPTAGVDNGVSYVGGGARPAAPRAHTSTTERAPAPRAQAGAGGVTVMPGGITVNNPTSNVDVQRAIRDYELERKERK